VLVWCSLPEILTWLSEYKRSRGRPLFLCFQVIPPEGGNTGAKGSWKQSQQKRTKTLGQPAGTESNAQSCFSWFPENQEVVFVNQLFLSAVNKNNLKQIYVRSGKERITQTNLYWFTFTPRATSSPQKPLVIHYAIKTKLQTPHTKVVTLNPSRNTLPLANHTKSVDLETLKNTQHFLATQIQKYSNQGRRE